MDAVWSPTDHKFDQYISKIEREMNNLHNIRKAAQTALTFDMQTIVKDTGKGMIE